MAPIPVDARDFILEVETDVADTFVAVSPDAITGIVVNPSENEEVSDDTTYGSRGNYEQSIMQRGATLAVTGRLMKDPDTGELDPGQARVEAIGALVGASSKGRIRFRYDEATPDWTIWTATVTLGEKGGETNARRGWAATFTRSGASTKEAVVVV